MLTQHCTQTAPLKNPTCTSYLSVPPGRGVTLRDTLDSASCMRRVPIARPVTALPDRPARGESLALNTMLQGHACNIKTGATRVNARTY